MEIPVACAGALGALDMDEQENLCARAPSGRLFSCNVQVPSNATGRRLERFMGSNIVMKRRTDSFRGHRWKRHSPADAGHLRRTVRGSPGGSRGGNRLCLSIAGSCLTNSITCEWSVWQV